MEAPAKIAEECKAKIASFQELLPLISAICNAGLHERHWEQIAAVVGFDVRPDEVTSLRRLLDYNIQDHIKVLTIATGTSLFSFPASNLCGCSGMSLSVLEFSTITSHVHCHRWETGGYFAIAIIVVLCSCHQSLPCLCNVSC